ncbi:MAG: SDR family oxidoreductase, partial [Armatimonadota bacterium]|nr:SDR family oxidoreductase [Armatimonadota bacterium]
MTVRDVAIVTAAAGAGIGSAVARELAQRGMDVVITDAHERRTMEMAQQLSELYEREFLGIPLDVSEEPAVKSAIEHVYERYGRIDVLVNNAGWNKLERIVDMSLETWRKCLAVNLEGCFYMLRHVLPIMIRQRKGAVVNISSAAAWDASVEHGAYAAAKAGVLALTRVAAAEVGEYGVRVNAVVPGLIYNEFLKRIYPDSFFEGA